MAATTISALERAYPALEFSGEGSWCVIYCRSASGVLCRAERFQTEGIAREILARPCGCGCRGVGWHYLVQIAESPAMTAPRKFKEIGYADD